MLFALGGIQQLRGQEEGEGGGGGVSKSARLSTQGSLESPRGPKFEKKNCN
jgi:hypothetical protein